MFNKLATRLTARSRPRSDHGSSSLALLIIALTVTTFAGPVDAGVIFVTSTEQKIAATGHGSDRDADDHVEHHDRCQGVDAAARLVLGKVLVAQGEPGSGRSMIESALPPLINGFGENHWLVADARAVLDATEPSSL